MFEELERGVALRDLIEEILREAPGSISQIGKALAGRGVKLHRLAVAGYLKALADTGVLVEREIPPAKVYGLRPAAARRDLHRQVADRCREAADDLEPARVYLQALQDLFLRPVFGAEMARAGFDVPVKSEAIGAEERQQVRRHLGKSPLKIPANDPAYRPRYDDPADEARHRAQARAALAALLRDEYRAASLAYTTKQATLGADS